MSVNLIVAVGKNNEIGKGNDLIWHFKEDMKFFKETTMGSAVIMGRKTFESLPKALPGRKNIIITNNSDYSAEGAEVVNSIDEALEKAGDNAFVIGGASIYKAMLPLCDKLYITEIDAVCNDAEVFFPEYDKSLYTRKELARHEVNGIRFSHILYTRKA
ncbi:MAG: dihydrofolate reductase [Eubacterium sp.]|nr:dihydrofolate reductase [Eubacterium sp.]